MLSIANKPIMLRVVLMNVVAPTETYTKAVVLLNVVVPKGEVSLYR
jgi:hypothetical protein